jgi:hypothetical protein
MYYENVVDMVVITSCLPIFSCKMWHLAYFSCWNIVLSCKYHSNQVLQAMQ